MSNERIPMSKEGYEKKKAQLDKMTNEDMPRIAEQIAQARGYGDLSENAEYDAAMEAQGMLQARINDLQDQLAPRNDRRSLDLAERSRRFRLEGPRR